MHRSLAYLRSESAARQGSIAFTFLVGWIVGVQASRGMSPEQWLAAAAAVAGALLVVMLVHGPEALFGTKRKG